ncbi:hypothetical protein [Lentzea aerocolonigenes]|uniref:hypothetical protein n=1 Tax=Lentzea aerocolonigenes TaxID=68170 RepID=UPI0004C2D6C2|nr:hypothetical protein [Lentzea aerocolonigenes]MCP2248739.1 hypothetical protein [Lentzea aerocolonigenes]
MSIELNARGPVFDERGPRAMREFADELGETLADDGVSVVRAEFATVVQHPTGRYSRSIHAVGYGSLHEVNDGGMVYGPWLAGVGSRNRKSRFKGYAHWRRSTQQLVRRIPALAQRLKPRLLGRLK